VIDGSLDRALVTGCAGFLGSHLCERLVDAGCAVIGIDSFSPYYDPALKRTNLARLDGHPLFRLVEGDLNELELAPLVADRQVVFHLAAQAGVRASWGEDFDVYLRANLRATQRLLEALAPLPRTGDGFRRLVYSSSSSIYGHQPRYPVTEDALPHPYSPYGVTKLAAEQLCAVYSANEGLPCSSLRYFTVYGPRQRPDMAFRRFCEAARRGEPWIIYGDGGQTRDFTYVDDAVRANLLAAADPTPYGAYNVGGGRRVALREVLEVLRARVLARGLATEVRSEHRDPARGDVRDTGADGAKAARVLGYRPEVGLEEGLDRMVRWMVEEAP
jgi:UDP-glucose 4-epimerase